MFVELHAQSAFSFLEGAELPEAYVAEAARLGMPALALGGRGGGAGAASRTPGRLLPRAKPGAPKGAAAVTLDDLAAHADGLVCLTGGARGPRAGRPPAGGAAGRPGGPPRPGGA